MQHNPAMRLRSLLFGLCRVAALILLPVLGKPQCKCQWTYHHYLIENRGDGFCDYLYDEVRAYYCGYYEWSYYYYVGYYCHEQGPRR